jgi:hypothetical protein
MHMIDTVRFLLRNPHGYRRLMISVVCDAVGNRLARCLLQWSACSWRSYYRLLWRKVVIPRLLA